MDPRCHAINGHPDMRFKRRLRAAMTGSVRPKHDAPEGRNDLKTGVGGLRREPERALRAPWARSMAAGTRQPRHPRKMVTNIPRPQRILEAARRLPKHQVLSASTSAFLKHKKRRKNQKRRYLAARAGP